MPVKSFNAVHFHRSSDQAIIRFNTIPHYTKFAFALSSLDAPWPSNFNCHVCHMLLRRCAFCVTTTFLAHSTWFLAQSRVVWVTNRQFLSCQTLRCAGHFSTSASPSYTSVLTSASPSYTSIFTFATTMFLAYCHPRNVFFSCSVTLTIFAAYATHRNGLIPLFASHGPSSVPHCSLFTFDRQHAYILSTSDRYIHVHMYHHIFIVFFKSKNYLPLSLP